MKIPGITQDPPWHDLPCRYKAKRGRSIIGIVLHDTCGTGTHADTLYLADPEDGREVSVDFTVEVSGAIWKLNPQLGLYYCFHAGRATSFRGLHNAQVTRATIGIELCRAAAANPSMPYPAPQIDSLVILVRWLLLRFHLTNADITTHQAIITDGSRDDPRNFPWWQFLAKLNALESAK